MVVKTNGNMSGVQSCVVFSVREFQSYSGPYARLMFFCVLLTDAHGDTCTQGYSYVALTAGVCNSTVVTCGTLFNIFVPNKMACKRLQTCKGRYERGSRPYY